MTEIQKSTTNLNHAVQDGSGILIIIFYFVWESETPHITLTSYTDGYCIIIDVPLNFSV